jgi:hypothetical protein
MLGRLACGLDSTGSGQGPAAGCCECGDEPSGSCATELVTRVLMPRNVPLAVALSRQTNRRGAALAS